MLVKSDYNRHNTLAIFIWNSEKRGLKKRLPPLGNYLETERGFEQYLSLAFSYQ